MKLVERRHLQLHKRNLKKDVGLYNKDDLINDSTLCHRITHNALTQGWQFETPGQREENFHTWG